MDPTVFPAPPHTEDRKKEKRNLGTRGQLEASCHTLELILKAEPFFSLSLFFFSNDCSNKTNGQEDEIKDRGIHTIQYGEAQRPTVAGPER